MLTPQQVEEKLLHDTLHPQEHPDALHESENVSVIQESDLFRPGEMVALNVHPTGDGPPLPAGADPGMHRHEFLELAYVWKGSCEMLVEGKRFHVGSGDILLLDTRSAHQPMVPKGTLLVNLILQPRFFDEMFFRNFSREDPLGSFFIGSIYAQKSLKRYLVFETGDDPRIRQLFMMLMQEYFSNELFSADIVGNLVSILFTTLVRLYRQKTVRISQQKNLDDGSVTEILQYLQENLLTATRESVAEHFGYSYSYISTVLQTATGLTFSKLKQGLRLQRAERLIRTTSLPISTVAEEAGFSNMTRFYEAFREGYGVSPQSYRQAAGNIGQASREARTSSP